ncbi:DUF3298 domain-containing protein [Terribacillus sp. DMT04]|uniref:DUF3298 and DUF4163 domain-containing protein n=1 Tax=Terribacillus sp. DMT04 TaxID=2850441 RepID=UPI001C2C387A|nr:DUF3298 domain-containing protein [Terribacillus sp. DMT04]QXE02427.1 DUF3298 and DUF4163 domain-containing protein [Terribacillus sp. DMT04]
MKFWKQPVTIVLIFILLAGCSTSTSKGSASELKDNPEKEEMIAKKLLNYETVELKDKTERSDIQIAYPKFDYEPLDKLIEPNATNLFEHHKTEKNDEGYYQLLPNMIYTYTSEFDEPIISDEFVSIHYNNYIYAGGAHGSPSSESLYFDLKENRALTIDEVLKKHDVSFRALSDFVSNALITDARFSEYRESPVSERYKQYAMKSTTPVPENYKNFKVTENSITIYNDYYYIFPMATGIVDIEVKWEDLKKRTKELEKESTANGMITYTNKEYGFELELPSSWKNKFTVEKSVSQITDTSYNFNFKIDDAVICNIFTIYVYEEEDYMEGPLETYIATKDRKVFTYGTIMEMPLEFSTDPNLQNEAEVLSKMVNEDVPKVMLNFTF